MKWPNNAQCSEKGAAVTQAFLFICMTVQAAAWGKKLKSQYLIKVNIKIKTRNIPYKYEKNYVQVKECKPQNAELELFHDVFHACASQDPSNMQNGLHG